jgi:hypothetical protein
MMKRLTVLGKVICFSLLTVCLGAQVQASKMEEKEEVERYSNEMPKAKVVWQGPIPKSFYFSLDGNRLFCEKTADEELSKVIRKKDFIEINWIDFPIKGDLVKDNYYLSKTHFYCKKEGDVFDTFLVMHCLYTKNTLSQFFSSHQYMLHDAVLSPNKWDYPRPVTYWMGRYEEITEMSWRYLDNLIHFAPNLQYSEEYLPTRVWERDLYKKVREVGFERAIQRVGCVMSKADKAMGFTVISNTNDDEKPSKEVEEMIHSVISALSLK